MESLKLRAARGMFWSVGERVFSQGALFAMSVILARILSPSEYGIVAMLLVFVNVADVLVTNGIGEALVQKQQPSKVDYSTMLICALSFSAFLYLIIFFSAPYIASFYGQPSIELLLRLLALRVPFSGFNAIQRARVAKEFAFRDLFFSSTIGSLLAGAVAIACAWYGLGVFALIVQQFLTVVLNSLFLFLLNRWLPGISLSKASMKELLPLGMQLSAANLVNSLYTEGRSLIIGKAYSPVDLAFFNRGNQFPSLVVSNLNTPISNVMLPVLSSVNHDMARLRSIARKSMQMVSYLVFPLLGFLFACAEPLVMLLLTDKWAGSIPFLQIACVFYLFQPVQTMNWQAIKAAGRGDLCLKLELLKKGIGFVLLFASIPFGVMAIAVTSALFGLVSMIINMLPNGKVIGYPMRHQFADLAKPFIATVIMTVVLLLSARSFADQPLLLLIQFGVGAVIYLLMSKVLKIEGAAYLCSELRARRKK